MTGMEVGCRVIIIIPSLVIDTHAGVFFSLFSPTFGGESAVLRSSVDNGV